MQSLTIRKVRARAVNAPMSRPVRTASGALNAAPLLLVDVETREGVIGHAYGLGYTLEVLDMALWDAVGKAMDTPVGSLLGTAPRPLPAYDSYGLVDPRKDQGQLEASFAAGFRAIKIKLGDAPPGSRSAASCPGQRHHRP